MNLGKKLQKLRKEKGMSQEEFAEKIGVSRQSVSKWESGNAYPEMEKLLIICNLFDVSLDDLTNEKIKTDEVHSSKEKTPINDFVYDIKKLIEKSVNMFTAMNGDAIFKLLFFMFLVCVGISLIRIPISYLYDAGRDFFNLFGTTAGPLLSGIWKLITELLYLIVGVMIFLYVYKFKYLDKFDGKKTEQKNEDRIEENTETIKEEKKIKKVIKKESENTGTKIINIFWNIILITLKIFAILFSFPFVIFSIMCVTGLVMCIWFVLKGIFFIGIILGLIGTLLLLEFVIEIICSFVANKKILSKRLFIELLISFALIGSGIGLSILQFTDYKFINEAPISYEKSIVSGTFTFDSQMTRPTNPNVEYYGEESLNNTIRIEILYYPSMSTPKIEYNDKTHEFNIWSMNDEFNFDVLSLIIENLKDKKIYNYYLLSEYEVKVYTSSANIDVLNKNFDQQIQKRINE